MSKTSSQILLHPKPWKAEAFLSLWSPGALEPIWSCTGVLPTTPSLGHPMPISASRSRPFQMGQDLSPTFHAEDPAHEEGSYLLQLRVGLETAYSHPFRLRTGGLPGHTSSISSESSDWQWESQTEPELQPTPPWPSVGALETQGALRRPLRAIGLPHLTEASRTSTWLQTCLRSAGWVVGLSPFWPLDSHPLPELESRPSLGV